MIDPALDYKERIRTSISNLLVSNGTVQEQHSVLIHVDRSFKIIVDSAVIRPRISQRRGVSG